MTRYAQLNADNTLQRLINTQGNVEWDATHYCPAKALTPEEAALFRVVPFVEVGAPEHDAITHVAVLDGGEFVDGKWQTKWRVDALPAEVVAANQATAAEQALANAKAARYDQVQAITVTTPLGTFDGNEDAQRRMTSAITGMDDGETLPWVLHDNTVVIVNKADLRLALRMAGAAMAAIWVAPYAQP